jgi:hypothetical protein
MGRKKQTGSIIEQNMESTHGILFEMYLPIAQITPAEIRVVPYYRALRIVLICCTLFPPPRSQNLDSCSRAVLAFNLSAVLAVPSRFFLDINAPIHVGPDTPPHALPRRAPKNVRPPPERAYQMRKTSRKKRQGTSIGV